MTASYGHGVYSQGEVYLEREQERLAGKKAFLQLWEHLMRHDERLKAMELFDLLPWDLETDNDCAVAANISRRHMEPFLKPQILKDYLTKDETESNDISRDEFLDRQRESFMVKRDPRARWVLEQAVTFNPKTILEMGAGFGSITLELARYRTEVTAVAPFEAGTEAAKQVAEEEALAIRWLHDVWPTVNEQLEDKYDLVVAAEIVEHLVFDVTFLAEMLGRTRRGLILTTPFGSVQKGFQFKDPFLVRGQHVRAYGPRTIERLLQAADPAVWDVKLETLPETSVFEELNRVNLDKESFCITFTRKGGIDDREPKPKPDARKRRARGAR